MLGKVVISTCGLLQKAASAVLMVLERRNGPRRLRNHDDDDYLFEVAICPACCRSRLCCVLSDDLLAADISSTSHTHP